MRCIHVASSERTGDEAPWCVACLRDRVRELEDEIEALRKQLPTPRTRERVPSQCQHCGRWFSTAQGLGLHFHWGCLSKPVKREKKKR